MHLPAFRKLLALFISGSILISSVPAYAGETMSPAEPVTSEASAMPEDAADNSGEEINDPAADEAQADESQPNAVDENRETPPDPDSEATTDDNSNIPDSETGGSEAGIEEDTNSQSDAVSQNIDEAPGTPAAGGRNISEADTSPAAGNQNIDETPTPPAAEDSNTASVAKNEPFAHQYHNDANDPAYDELRKELAAIFRNAQLQDITDLPSDYSLVSLPFGGGGPGGIADRSSPITADRGRDVLMPVLNQGDTMNTCWSFTGTGIIESYLIRNNYDKLREQGIELSKWQIPVAAYLHVSQNTVTAGYAADPSQYGESIGNELNAGGTPMIYGQAVTSWAGLDYEKNVPTPIHRNDIAELTPAQIDQAVVRGGEALFLPNPAPNVVGHDGYDKKTDPSKATGYDPSAVAAIKNCLMKIGPVYVEVCYRGAEPAEKGGINKYENWEYGSMYYPMWTDDTMASHAVTIVGWDDHYSRELFGENTPPGDGAFLIKNSFGKMGDDSKAGEQSLFREGYLWLSYYDATIQTPATFTGTLVEDGKYDHLYMNDYNGFANANYVEIKDGAFDSDRDKDGVIRKDELVKCANVFKARGDEMLKSVGMLANRANSLAEYWIYLLKEGYSNPEDGELVYSATGENGIKAKYSGYNVQDLTTPIALVKGQLFSVVARIFGAEGGQLPLEVGSSMCDASEMKIARGQTFFTDKNGNWVDACDFKTTSVKTTSEVFWFKVPNDTVESVGNATVRAMTADADLSYKVTRGDGSEWKSGTSSGLKISASGAHGKFSYLMIDGKLIEPSEYTISGSRTDAALSAELLKRLGEGGHTIMFVYDDGWATGTFFVAGDHHESEEESCVDCSGPALSKSSSPQTGDTTSSGLPMCAVLIMISFTGVAAARRSGGKRSQAGTSDL